MTEAVAIATMVMTLILAGATVLLAIRTSDLAQVARQELDTRDREVRRSRAMSLLTVVVRGLDILRSFETEVARGHGLQHGLVGSMYDAGAAKWGRLDNEWGSLRPELSTWLYVCDFVPDDLRLRIDERFTAIATEVSTRNEDRAVNAVKNLKASLDEVRDRIDRELGLKASRRPL